VPDVFDQAEVRTEHANHPSEVPPKARALGAKPCLIAGATEILAGESAADDARSWLALVDVSHVLNAGAVWPMLGEDCPAIGVFLSLPDDRPQARCFETELEPSDAREHAADGPRTLGGVSTKGAERI
jgi:hypothetical protein